MLKNENFGFMLVSEEMCNYPFPNPILTGTFYQLAGVALGVG